MLKELTILGGLATGATLIDKYASRLGLPWNTEEKWFWERIFPSTPTIRPVKSFRAGSALPKNFSELAPQYRGPLGEHEAIHNPGVQADAPLRFHVGNPGKLLSFRELYRAVKKQPKITPSKELRYRRTASGTTRPTGIFVGTQDKAY